MCYICHFSSSTSFLAETHHTTCLTSMDPVQNPFLPFSLRSSSCSDQHGGLAAGRFQATPFLCLRVLPVFSLCVGSVSWAWPTGVCPLYLPPPSPSLSSSFHPDALLSTFDTELLINKTFLISAWEALWSTLVVKAAADTVRRHTHTDSRGGGVLLTAADTWREGCVSSGANSPSVLVSPSTFCL